jgi:hypothetical protein
MNTANERVPTFRVLLIALLAAAAAPLFAAGQGGEEAEVLAAVEQFFEGMEAGDADEIREVVFPEGQFFRVRIGADGSQFSTSTIQDLMNTVSDPEVDYLERIWDAEVKVEGPLATVWAPYDFYRDGAFSHCGVDAFNLLKTDEGWKLANAAYTVQTAGCPPSPLGPPRNPKETQE